MKKIFLTIFSIILVFSLAACSQKSSTKEEKVLKLGVVPSSNSEKLVDDLEPFAKALGEKLGVKVEVFTASSYIGVAEVLTLVLFHRSQRYFQINKVIRKIYL